MVLKLYRQFATQFQSFNSTSEMDEHIQAHTFIHGRKLHKNAKAILTILRQHSICTYGVSWLNTETIAKKLGVCTKTVKRAIQRLQELKIGHCEEVTLECGVTLTYFVLHPFDMSTVCPEIDNEVSSDLSLGANESSPMISSVQPTSEDSRAIELNDLENKEEDDYISNDNSLYIAEFIEQAKAHSLPDLVIKRILPKIKNYRFTVDVLKQCLSIFIEKYKSGSIASIGSYFKALILDKQAVSEFNQNSIRHNVASKTQVSFPTLGYNWLEA